MSTPANGLNVTDVGVVEFSGTGFDTSAGTAGQVYTSNGAGMLPTFQDLTTGVVLQIQSAVQTTLVSCSTALPDDNTIPQITEGDEVITVSITPISASSTLLIMGNVWGTMPAAGQAAMALFVDATADALGTVGICNGSTRGNGTIFYVTSSASTSTRTYRIRAGASASTFQVNGSAAGANEYGATSQSRITVIEIG